MPDIDNKAGFEVSDELTGKHAIPTVLPPKINDTDVDGSLYSNIIEAGLSSQLNIGAFSTLEQDATNRNQMYNVLDAMCEDGTISAVVETYAEDSTERNDTGRIVWVESSNAEVAKCVEYLIDTLNIDKHIFKWVYSLCKYGDVYLRLYRKSEFEDELFPTKKEEEKKTLNEDVKIVAFNNRDRYAHYMEMVANPASMFELTKYGKTIGYIQASPDGGVYGDNQDNLNGFANLTYNFKKDDIIVYPATEFVHAALEDNVGRQEETVNISTASDKEGQPDKKFTYSVRKGQSLLTDVYKVWRELSLLEASVLLNRITKSSIVRLINVEVGDMPKENVTKTLMNIKQMVEQKSSLNKGKSLQEYTNPGPVENNVYVPTHEGVGAITTSQIGGDVDVKSLADLEYYMNKLYGQLRVPKQFFCLRGDTPILLLNGQTRTLKYLFEHKDEFIGKGIMSCSSNGTLSPTTIKNIMLTKPNASFIRIHLDNGKFVDVTPEHRMMLRDGTFVEAQELNINDSLMPYYDKIIDRRRYVLDNNLGKWKPQYRLVAESIYSEEELKDKQVHHIDHIKINDDFENLIPLTGKEHILEHINEMHFANIEANKVRRDNNIAHGNKGKFSITNGIENRWLNSGDLIPEGFYLGQTCNYTAEGRRKIAESTSAANTGRSPWIKGKTRLSNENVDKMIIKMMKTRSERESKGEYEEMHKKQSGLCKRNNSWKKMHEGHMKLIPENRKAKERYVRCVFCGAIHKIKCNDDWYKEYLNLDKLWYCSKECYKFDGRGKLAHSYRLYKECNNDIDKYSIARKSDLHHRSDFYFLPETLETKLPIIDNYVPECNHKVINIEWIDVDEPAYDIEVASENHTFALPCGIFVHNCQTDDSTGFNGGTSLSIISSRYAKMIKRIQNTILQALTDAINLMLLDKNLDSYINKFTLHMLPPTTQEEIDRRDNMSSKVQLVSDIQGMLADIENPLAKMKILKCLVSTVVDDNEILAVIQEEIDALENEEKDAAPEDKTEVFDEVEGTEEPSAPSSDDFDITGSDLLDDTEGSDVEGNETILPTPDELGIDMSDTEE